MKSNVLGPQLPKLPTRQLKPQPQLDSSRSQEWAKQMNETPKTNSNPSPIPTVSKDAEKPSSNELAESNQSSNNPKALKVKPRLRAEGLMVPPASDAATLRRQVAALQADVEAHIEAEQRLQGFNQQLNERLELYMKQNHDNLERAENEMNTLHEDMEQTLELQRRLSKRAGVLEGEKKDLDQALQSHLRLFEAERSSLQAKVTSLSTDLQLRADAEYQANAFQKELEKTQAMNAKLHELLRENTAEAFSMKLRVEDCRKKIQNLLAEERRNNEIGRLHRISLLRRCFMQFQERIREQQAVQCTEKEADRFQKLICCKRGFRDLKLATRRSKMMRLANAMHKEAFLQDAWNEWRLTAAAHRKCEAVLQQRERTLVIKALRGWKNLIYASYNQGGQYADLAAKHWRSNLLKRIWGRWFDWLIYCSKPKKMRLQEAYLQLVDSLCRQAVAAWKCVVRVKRIKKLKMQEGLSQQRLWCKKKTFRRWREVLRVKHARRTSFDKIKLLRRSHCCDLVIRRWREFVSMKSNAKSLSTIAENHYSRVLRRKELKVWKLNADFKKSKAKAIAGFNQALLKTTLGFWQKYHLLQSIKKKKEKKSTVYRQRKERKVLKKIFLSWWEEMCWERHTTDMQRSLASWWQRTLLRSAYHSWMYATFGNALLTNIKCQSALQEAKEKCENQRHRTTAVDVENLHLIDRLHMMSSEIAFLMTSINEKSTKHEQLHHALEDGTLIESSMRGELEQQRLRVEELEKEAALLQRSLQKKNSEDVAGEVYHALSLQSLEHNIRNVRAQLSQKSSQVVSYEKALKETAEKLEGTSDESHQKLSNAFQIAASLRKLLEDRESQCAALEGSCRRRDLELAEIQKKLSLNKSAFVETLEARDIRIHELERLLLQRQVQIEQVQQDVQDVQVAINMQDSCYKKLEYEMRLTSGGNNKMRDFQTCESWLL